jgi:hypothetical protein
LVCIQLSTAGAKQVGDREVDVGHAARQIKQRLPEFQRDEDPAAVQVAAAHVEQAGDVQRLAAAAGAGDTQLVAERHTEVLRQLDADQRTGAGHIETAARHVVVHAHHAPVVFGLHAQQHHALAAAAARSKGRAADHWRHRQHAGRASCQRRHALPLIHRTQSLLARLHHGRHRALGIRCDDALRDFFERADHHMRL